VLLEASGLRPGTSNSAPSDFLGSRDDRGLAAVVGLEVFGKVGLLRSLAVRPDNRGTGLGGTLVGAAEELAAQQGIVELFLLTTTAEPFLRQAGVFPARSRLGAGADTRHPGILRPLPIDSRIHGQARHGPAALIRSSTMSIPSNHPFRVLFVCTGNSARSQIAQTLLNRKGRGRFIADSAGSQPAEWVNPMAISTMEKHGYFWTGHPPQGLDAVMGQPWDFVITVCDRAKESCPIFPGQPVMAHWGMPDPAEATGTETERERAFDDTLLLISRRLDLFLALPMEKLEKLALQQQVNEIGGVGAPPVTS
jgi:protein-tyrosine-phosphatase